MVTRCTLCDAPAATALCAACAERLRPAPGAPVPAGLDDCVAVLALAGAGRDLVLAHKRGAAGGLRPALADALGVALGPGFGPGGPLAGVHPGALVVTWAPTTPARRRRRGRDHAAELAYDLARSIGAVPHALLARAPGPAQSGRSRSDRAGGPRFAALGPVPAAVVVVDDVATTGATLTAAARCLRAGGARVVVGACLARTPLAGAPVEG